MMLAILFTLATACCWKRTHDVEEVYLIQENEHEMEAHYVEMD